MLSGKLARVQVWQPGNQATFQDYAHCRILKISQPTMDSPRKGLLGLGNPSRGRHCVEIPPSASHLGRSTWTSEGLASEAPGWGEPSELAQTWWKRGPREAQMGHGGGARPALGPWDGEGAQVLVGKGQGQWGRRWGLGHGRQRGTAHTPCLSPAPQSLNWPSLPRRSLKPLSPSSGLRLIAETFPFLWDPMFACGQETVPSTLWNENEHAWQITNICATECSRAEIPRVNEGVLCGHDFWTTMFQWKPW